MLILLVSYQSITKTLEILRRQLERATKDVDKLKTLKQEALDEPFAFIANLKNVCCIYF
jgi:hypothetical protein